MFLYTSNESVDHGTKEHFLGTEAPGPVHRRASVRALEQLRVHDWPGNVRELRHAIARTLAWTDEVLIESFDLRVCGKPADAPNDRRGLGWSEVARLLHENDGRLQPTSEALQVSVRTLQRRMRDLGMNARDFR